FLRFCGQCASNIVGSVEAIEDGRKGFTNQKLNDPVGRVENPVAVVFTVLIAEFQPVVHADEMRPKQTFVDVAQLPDLKGAVINRFVGAQLALTRARASRWLGEYQLAQNIRKRSIAHTPGFEFGMKIGIEKPAVVA